MWLWCPRCQRCFRATQWRRDLRGLPLCPYDDCSGSWFKSLPWILIRRLDLALPPEPELDVLYSQLPYTG